MFTSRADLGASLARKCVVIFTRVGLFGAVALQINSASCRYAGPPQSELDSKLRKRAAFDLSCPEADLALTPLSEPSGVGIVTAEGVSGCGKKASYLLSGGSSPEWILNSDSSDAPAKK